jgi:hypothetical protein
MERNVSIDVYLISEITGLPIDDVKPEKYMDYKTKEKALEDEIKIKYGTDRWSRGMIIRQINDPAMKFMTKLMACKLLMKCRKEEAPARVIAATT